MMNTTILDGSGVERGPDGGKRYTTRPSSLVASLRASVERSPQAEALVELGGERLSYQALWDAATRVAGGLKQQGLQRGDRAAIRLGNGGDWVKAFWGCILGGIVVVPVNTRFTDTEAEYVIDNAGAGWVFEAGQALPDGTPHALDDLTADDTAAIFYTSGTTGFPKGAVTSHRNLLSNTETVRRMLHLPTHCPQMRNLISVPLFHVTGCDSQLLPTLELGGTAVIMPSFDIKAFIQAIAKERINHLITVPAIYWLAINQPEFARLDTHGVETVSYGGAPISPALVQQLMQAFPAARLANGFGLTETTSVATFLPHEYAADNADSVGIPSPVMETKLADINPETGVGELLLKGSNVVSGYWNKPEATASTFIDGWLHTGDLARIDDQGLVYIVDRKKDMINRGGENVYCVEVENALAGCPGVGEAAVVGVPDSMMGEKVGAVIVPVPGHRINPQDVADFCRQQLADFKVPQYVALRSQPLPRNPAGKVLKPELRESTQWGSPLW